MATNRKSIFGILVTAALTVTGVLDARARLPEANTQDTSGAEIYAYSFLRGGNSGDNGATGGDVSGARHKRPVAPKSASPHNPNP